MEFEKQIVIDNLKGLKKQDVLDFDYFTDDSDVSSDKDSEKSKLMRKRGNKLFAKKNHDKKVHETIWMLYSQSIALAPNESEELAAAYANRSAFLFHLRKFDKSLLDIDRALKITKSSSLKVKLLCRQSECYVSLQEGRARNSLTKAKYWLKKVESNLEVEKLTETISNADKVVENNISDLKKKDNASKIPYSRDYVNIGFNETFGKHLVVTKNIQPGEFVCAEKFYVTSVNRFKNYAYCSHCLAISWTLIPCDQCSLYMFCSENCKSEAWEKYHDVECLMKFPYHPDNLVHYFVQLSIKSIIMGIRESGDINKLKVLILKIEQSTDKKRKGFSVKNKSASSNFEHLISLTSSKSKKKLLSCVIETIRAVIKLIENTHILANFEISDDLEELIQHEDVIFIGSLFLRLMSICLLNASHALHFTEACKGKEHYCDCLEDFCCSRGMYISPITSIIHHNCNNNVERICSNDGRVMYYALQPINKNDQIQISYCSNFTISDKEDRQEELSRIFEFDCNCITCQEDWPTIKTLMNMNPPIRNVFGLDISIFIAKYKKIMKALEDPKYKPSKKTLNTFAEDTRILFKKTSQPNVVANFFTYILLILMENTYCIKLDIPEKCKSILK